MGECKIYAGSRELGTLHWEEAGLYLRFQAACGLPEEAGGQVCRLWAVGETGETCLGVPVPEDGRCLLERRLSRSSWTTGPTVRAELRYPGMKAAQAAPLPDAAAQAAPPEPEPAGTGPETPAQRIWEPWQGREDVWFCREGETLLLAAPWDRGGCALAPMFALCRSETIEGRPCLVAELTNEDEIVLDDAPGAAGQQSGG